MRFIALVLALGSTFLAPPLPHEDGVGDPVTRSREVTEYFDYTIACYDRCSDADLHIAQIEPRCSCGTSWSDDDTSRLMEKALTYFHRIECGTSAECSAAWTRMWNEVDLDKEVK